MTGRILRFYWLYFGNRKCHHPRNQTGRVTIARFGTPGHHHGYQPLPSAQLRYFARSGESSLALFGFGTAAWKATPRDNCIGWNARQREAHLHLVENNARFLILLRVHSSHLAQELLDLVA